MSLGSSLHSFLARERQARVTGPAFRTAGGFDRAAIMREAVKIARGMNAWFGTWSRRMGAALRQVWRRAKADLAAQTVAPEPFPVRVAVRASRPTYAPRTFVRGSRAFTHGW